MRQECHARQELPRLERVKNLTVLGTENWSPPMIE